MPPRENSRHTFCTAWLDRYGSHPQFLTTRIPFRFQPRDDNKMVVAKDGDTLFALAGKHFKPLFRPCGLWWVIGDFQPQPVHDPTLQLAAGRTIIIPSLRTVQEEILDDERVYEAEV